RSLDAVLPTASTVMLIEPCLTGAVRTPRFCCTRELTDTPLSSLPPPSAYIGTSCMSMNGDLPGLSNFCPGTIGSCQYRTFLPVLGSMSPAFCAAPEAPPAAEGPLAICMPRLMPNQYSPYPLAPTTAAIDTTTR